MAVAPSHLYGRTYCGVEQICTGSGDLVGTGVAHSHGDTGKKLGVASEPGGDLAMLEIRPTREFVYTPTALIPGVIFVLVVLMFTAGAFGIIGNWPIQFG
jgi:hypothetical protein